MRDPYGYRPYRGSRVRRRGIILNTLLAAAIFAAAVWVLCLLLPLEEGGLRFPGQTAVGTDDGAVQDDVDTPVGEKLPEEPQDSALRPAEPEPAPAPDGMSGGWIGTSPMKNMEKTGPLFPERPEGPRNTRMVLLSADAFAAQADQLLSLFQEGVLTGVVVTMKDERGTLFYPSEIADVQGRTEIVQPVEGLAEAAARLHAAGIPLTAVMYTHRDDRFPRLDERIALQNVNHIGWRDPDSRIFLDPANEEATAYLTAVAQELEALGFTEILLRGIGYPSYGWLQRIAYAEDRFGAVTGFVKAVQTAAPSIRVSVWLDSPSTAQNEDTGQSVSALYEAASRVFAMLPDPEDGGAAALQAAVLAAAGENRKLVTAVTSLSDAEALAVVLLDVPLEELQ